VNGEVLLVDDVPGAFVEVLVEAFRNREHENFALALCGGSTGRACYERVAQEALQKIDWWEVDFYWGDERCVPPDDPDSNQRMAREVLLEKIGAANAIYPMRCEEGPEAYQMRLAELGQFDLVHLGMGPDGHVASLFPDSPALDADPGILVSFNHDPHGRNRHRRMTLTFSGIARSKLVVVTVQGSSKAEALDAVRRGVPLPAARLQAERLIWIVDPPAAPWARRQ